MLYHALHSRATRTLFTKDWKNKDLWEKSSLELEVMLYMYKCLIQNPI